MAVRPWRRPHAGQGGHPGADALIVDLEDAIAAAAPEGIPLLCRAAFASRSAIHPAQVPIINEVFTPTAEEVAAASSVVEAHEQALAAGTGVTVDGDGRMVDEAVIRSARRTLQRRPSP